LPKASNSCAAHDELLHLSAYHNGKLRVGLQRGSEINLVGCPPYRASRSALPAAKAELWSPKKEAFRLRKPLQEVFHSMPKF